MARCLLGVVFDDTSRLLAMVITITMLTATSQMLTVHPKHLIETKLGIAAQTQKLVLEGSQRTPLKDDSLAVSSSGLRAGSRVCVPVKESETIQVFLRNETGQPSTYKIHSNETGRCGAERGVSVSQQRFIHQGRKMVSKTLEDDNVRALSTIGMTFRPRGG